MGLANKLGFVRDRLMESYFWTIGIVWEPQFNNCRKGLTKVAALITTIDDVYDVYGSLEELEMFTDIVQRFVPQQNQFLFHHFFELFLNKIPLT